VPERLDRSCSAVGAVERSSIRWEVPAAIDIGFESLLILHIFFPAFLRHLVARLWLHAPVYPCFWPIWRRVLATHARLLPVLALLVPHRVEDERMHVLGHLRCPEERR